MKIEPTSELLSAYVDGELTADEQAVVEQAIRDDPDVRRMYDELRTLRFTLQSMPRYQGEVDLTERIMRQAERTMLVGEGSPTQLDRGQDAASNPPPGPRSPSFDTKGGTWPSWSVAVSVLGTLAALLLLALWLPTTADRHLARSVARDSAAEAPSQEAASQTRALQDSAEAGASLENADLIEPESPVARSEPSDEATLEREEGLPPPAISVGRGMEIDAAAATEADAMEPASISESEQRDRSLQQMAEDGAAYSKSESYYLPGSTAKKEPDSRGMDGRGRSRAKGSAGDVRSGELAGGADMSGQPADVAAVRFQTASKQQLINRFNSDQMVYVELSLVSEQKETADSSYEWFEQKLTPAALEGLSMSQPQAGQTLAFSFPTEGGYHIGQLARAEQVLVAEGSADQIRAALVTLSDLDSVQIKLASSAAAGHYARALQSWQLGAQPPSISVRREPDAEDGQPDRLATDAPASAQPGEPQASSSAGRDLNSERESLMRMQKSPGESADLADKGQRRPDAAAGGFGAAGGQSAAAPSPPSRAMSRSNLEEPTADREATPSSTRPKSASAGSRQLGDTASDAASGDRDSPQAVKSGKPATESERPLGEAASGAKPTRYFGQGGGAGLGGGERATEPQPQSGPAGSVAKPRRVRILFRVARTASDTESSPKPTDPAGPAPASQEKEKSPLEAPDKE